MSNQLEVMKQLQALLPAAARAKAALGNINEAFSGGITSGFGVLSIRGKVWRQKYQGEERIVMDDDNRTPRYKIEVVLVKASPVISKTWYEHGYTDGASAPPDCFSMNGITPEPTSPKIQSKFCKTCKWNQWGSSRAQGGSGKGKDCSDTKRIAVVPAGDLRNERFGGPMLLRIPPASLAEVDTYARHLGSMAMPLDSVVTEMDFDPAAQYPKIRLKAARVLTDEEYAIIEEVGQSPVVNRILDTQAELAATTDGIDETRVEDPGVPPIQQVQQPPAGFTPQAKPAPAPAATEPLVYKHADGTLHTVPEMQRPSEPTPPPKPPQPIPPQPEEPDDGAKASTPWPDEDGVIMEEVPDENRQKLRDMKLTEAQINAALGPPKLRVVPVKETPKVELPDTAMVQAMRAAGVTDEKIAHALKTLGPAAVEPAKEAKPAARRGRPPKAEAKAEPKVDEAASQAAQEAITRMKEAAAQAMPKSEEPVQAANGNGEAGNGELKSSGASEGSAMPADLENLLDEMLGAHPK